MAADTSVRCLDGTESLRQPSMTLGYLCVVKGFPIYRYKELCLGRMWDSALEESWGISDDESWMYRGLSEISSGQVRSWRALHP
jgi:hypothetical protein